MFNTTHPSFNTGLLQLTSGFEFTPLERVFNSGAYHGGVDPFLAHRITDFTVVYADKGAGSLKVDLHKHTIHPGAFLFLSPRQLVQFDSARSYGGYLMRFSEDFLHPLGQSEETLAISRVFGRSGAEVYLDARRHRELITFFELIQKECGHKPDALHEAIIRSSLDLMLLHAGRLMSHPIQGDEKNTGHAYYAQFRRLIDNEATYGRNATDYAAEIGISYKYLNDLCKRFAGVTAKDLIDQQLIAEAKRMLVKDGFSAGEAARQLGFNDPSNFRKYFRKLTGQTPGLFREQNH